MTTSIPEAPGSVRNWDYRYCWLRDAAFVVRALNRLGATRTMEQFLGYIFNLATTDGTLQPLYGIGFEAKLDEDEVPSLSGYRGMGPVRRGNLAWVQRQHDVYGSVVLASTQLFFDRRLQDPGDAHTFARLEPLGEQAFALHDVPDAGLWEFRGRTEVHTYTSAMCWAACDRLCKIAVRLKRDDRAHYWRERADTIHARIMAESWSEELGHFTDTFGGHRLDASLLLLADIGFIDALDARFIATVEAIGRDLKHGNSLYRYVAPDDFGEPETSFTICTFWYIDALAASITAHLATLSFKPDLIVASFHGMPQSYIDKGDPYQAQCVATVNALRARMGLDDKSLMLTFQSRFGYEKWLQPYTAQTVEQLAKDGVRRIAVVTPGFAADCIETLEEIVMENAEIFRHAGGEEFSAIPCLNDSGEGMDVIRQIVLRELQGWI